MPRSRKRRPAGKATPDLPFNPIPLRERHDGWTADRQIAFIDALAATGCVTDAARTVGMSVRSAYRLRAHPEAGSFRLRAFSAKVGTGFAPENAPTMKAIFRADEPSAHLENGLG